MITKVMPMYLDFLDSAVEIEQEANPIKPWSRRAFLEELSLQYSKYYIAVQFQDENQIPDHLVGNEEVSGFIGMHLLEPEGFITNIAVREKSRNKGIGSLLLEKIFEDARKFKLETVSLEVRESNSVAIRLYKKYGFEVLWKRKNYYQDTKEDGLIMTKANAYKIHY